MQRYLAQIERSRAVKTYLNAHAALAVQLVPVLGADAEVDTIDRDMLQSWVDRLVAQGYAIGTVSQYLIVAGTFFRWRTEGAHTPTIGVAIPDPGERGVQLWTDDELEALHNAADTLDRSADFGTGPRAGVRSYRLLLELGLATGCRAAELGALEWSAFNAAERTVRVRLQLPPDGYGKELQPLKGRTNRTALVLPSWWAFHDADARGPIVAASRPSHRSLSYWCEQIINAAGLKRDRQNAHSFRHTYARLCLEMGARLEELQRFLGHASIRTTESSYGWLTEQRATTLARARIYGEGIQFVRVDGKARDMAQRARKSLRRTAK